MILLVIKTQNLSLIWYSEYLEKVLSRYSIMENMSMAGLFDKFIETAHSIHKMAQEKLPEVSQEFEKLVEEGKNSSLVKLFDEKICQIEERAKRLIEAMKEDVKKEIRSRLMRQFIYQWIAIIVGIGLALFIASR